MEFQNFLEDYCREGRGRGAIEALSKQVDSSIMSLVFGPVLHLTSWTVLITCTQSPWCVPTLTLVAISIISGPHFSKPHHSGLHATEVLEKISVPVQQLCTCFKYIRWNLYETHEMGPILCVIHSFRGETKGVISCWKMKSASLLISGNYYSRRK